MCIFLPEPPQVNKNPIAALLNLGLLSWTTYPLTLATKEPGFHILLLLQEILDLPILTEDSHPIWVLAAEGWSC